MRVEITTGSGGSCDGGSGCDGGGRVAKWLRVVEMGFSGTMRVRCRFNISPFSGLWR